MNDHQRTAIDALERSRGDDAQRARMAFRGMSHDQMNQQWGQSGKTCRQILDEYIAHDAKVDAALAWVKAQL